MRQRRILYISDSLGTPVPQRGIFNFSVALIERLKSSNANVTLLVERSNGHGLGRQWLDHTIEYERAMDSWQNNSIFRYLGSEEFSYELTINEHLDFAARDAAQYRAVTYLQNNEARHIDTIIRNIDNDLYLVQDCPIEKEAKRLKKQTRLEYIARHFDRLSLPYYSRATSISNDLVNERNRYLLLFDGFLTINQVYSEALTRAHNFVQPFSVDCSDFDEVIIDGPHYLSLKNVDKAKTSVILYDLIPFINHSLSEESHRSFSQKYFASLDIDANVIFISLTSQKEFHKCFPGRKLRSERVIYPPIKEVLDTVRTDLPEVKSMMAQIIQERLSVPENAPIKTRFGLKSLRKASFSDQVTSSLPNWNPELPYFVTVLSDEPYKNAALCVSAFAMLESNANLLVLGRMDPIRYLGNNTRANIHFAGFVSDLQKKELIAGSAGLIFPSFYEGFGLPVLEGALCGVPVLCSDIDVFREIVGSNAEFFDPYDPAELVACIHRVLSDPVGSKSRSALAKAFVLEKFRPDNSRNL